MIFDNFLKMLGIFRSCGERDYLCQYTDGQYSFDQVMNDKLSDLGGYQFLLYMALAALLTTFIYKMSSKQKVASSGLFHSYSKKPSSIHKFKDQNDVNRMLAYYENEYVQQNPSAYKGSFNGRAVFENNAKAYFQAIPYLMLNPGVSRNIIAQQIKDWEKGMLAYLLLNNLELPDSLNSAMIINHQNRHWTSVQVGLQYSEDARREWNKIRKQFFTSFLKSPENSWINQADRSTIDYQVLNSVINFLSNFQSLPGHLTLTHYDSLNSSSFHNAVCRDLERLIEIYPWSEFYYEQVPQQLGSTCSEHAVRNAMKKTLFDLHETAQNSYELRALTNRLLSL